MLKNRHPAAMGGARPKVGGERRKVENGDGMYDTWNMGRVYAEIRENGRSLWAMFDTGSKNTYITRAAAEGFFQRPAVVPLKVGLGGRQRTVDKICALAGTIEGKPVEVEAYVTEELSTDDSGRPVDVLFGALAMQKWHIHVKPADEKLDMTNYPKEFIEY